jgi:hypothetical protein
MDMDIDADMDMEFELLLKYFLRRNCPYSAIWNASEISRRNFQWRCILVALFHYGKKIHTAVGIALQMMC